MDVKLLGQLHQRAVASIAAFATFALKADVCFRRGLLLMLPPDSRANLGPPSGRSSNYRPVQIPETASVCHATLSIARRARRAS
jgi:hypothetical protein